MRDLTIIDLWGNIFDYILGFLVGSNFAFVLELYQYSRMESTTCARFCIHSIFPVTIKEGIWLS